MQLAQRPLLVGRIHIIHFITAMAWQPSAHHDEQLRNIWRTNYIIQRAVVGWKYYEPGVCSTRALLLGVRGGGGGAGQGVEVSGNYAVTRFSEVAVECVSVNE